MTAILKEDNRLGYCSGCVDRRYVEDQRRAFEEKTGLGGTDYWYHTEAGGAARIVEKGAFAAPDHAYHEGARRMGWGGHGDRCGGYPGLDNAQLEDKLDAVFPIVQDRYPNAIHYRVWSEGDPPRTIVTEIQQR